MASLRTRQAADQADDPFADLSPEDRALLGEAGLAASEVGGATLTADDLYALAGQMGIDLSGTPYDETTDGLSADSYTPRRTSTSSRWVRYRGRLNRAAKKAGLSDASRNALVDQFAMRADVLSDPKAVEKLLGKFTAPETLAQYATQDQFARALQDLVLGAQAPIDQAESEFRMRQAAVQAAVGPSVMRLIASHGGPNSPAAAWAAAYRAQAAAQAPDFDAQRREAANQILNSQTGLAARQQILDGNTQRAADAQGQFLMAQFQRMLGVAPGESAQRATPPTSPRGATATRRAARQLRQDYGAAVGAVPNPYAPGGVSPLYATNTERAAEAMMGPQPSPGPSPTVGVDQSGLPVYIPDEQRQRENSTRIWDNRPVIGN